MVIYYQKFMMNTLIQFQYQQSPRGYTFKCQHGPAECLGNMVHACAIKHVAQVTINHTRGSFTDLDCCQQVDYFESF